ncbi:hypothetical protein I0D00_01810 [Pseudomonas lalucatii]|uniref:DUF945 domain-containing protein n=1 Tax=Pseudomonas lalucatii TaxID=1424203 RepID=A0ABS5PWC7_9PSED|nr:hypothetical protein [Pseudomonas lalucatii]MBS7660684.1 hypothetical protein [Pseudomonas lalucatii]MBS7691370.1 hypothetical protein [Pseudomonas lalucatii]MBS7724511.1 hypothetical protein [Pseudomonas lalucatii]QVM87493.1 hypothetical protein I0D68_20790 [Pseudomonas lalucatii]
MSKLIKWAVLAVLAVAVLIKLSLWLSVRSIMEDAARQLSPIMEIRYGGITSSFDGRVGLSQIEVRVPAMGDSLRISHAALKFEGLGELLRFKERLAEGRFPEQMAVSLEGLSLDVHGPFMRQLYAVPAERSVLTAMSEVACGKIRTIGTDELLDMGYRTFETDGEFSYRIQPGARRLHLNLTSDTRDIGELRVALSLINMADNPADVRVSPPRVERLSVELNDNQYQRRVQAYCAAKLDLAPEAYRKLAVEQLDKVLRSQRVALDQPLLDAYALYLEDPRALHVEFQPSEGMVWDGLQFFDAKDVLAMLRPAVLVNHQAVQPLGFAWVDPTVRLASATSAPAAVERVGSVAAGARTGFVTVSSLADHVGKRLRFVTYDGMYYQGILTRVANDKAYLRLQAGNGTAQMSLRLEKIDKVRVQF